MRLLLTISLFISLTAHGQKGGVLLPVTGGMVTFAFEPASAAAGRGHTLVIPPGAKDSVIVKNIERGFIVWQDSEGAYPLVINGARFTLENRKINGLWDSMTLVNVDSDYVVQTDSKSMAINWTNDSTGGKIYLPESPPDSFAVSIHNPFLQTVKVSKRLYFLNGRYRLITKKMLSARWNEKKKKYYIINRVDK